MYNHIDQSRRLTLCIIKGSVTFSKDEFRSDVELANLVIGGCWVDRHFTVLETPTFQRIINNVTNLATSRCFTCVLQKPWLVCDT